MVYGNLCKSKVFLELGFLANNLTKNRLGYNIVRGSERLEDTSWRFITLIVVLMFFIKERNNNGQSSSWS